MSGAGSSSLLPLESPLLPKTSLCKRFMATAPGQTSKSGCQKCPVNSINMSLCGYKIQVSSKKRLFHEIIDITMLKPKPYYGAMALNDYAQSVALALQYVVQTDLGHLTQAVCFIPSLIVHAKAWGDRGEPFFKPFQTQHFVFYIHWGSIWGCSWAAPWAPHFAYGHGHRQTG